MSRRALVHRIDRLALQDRKRYKGNPFDLADGRGIDLICTPRLPDPDDAYLWVERQDRAIIYRPEFKADPALHKCVICHESSHDVLDVPQFVELAALLFPYARRAAEGKTHRYCAMFLIGAEIPRLVSTPGELAEWAEVLPEIAEVRWRIERGEPI